MRSLSCTIESFRNALRNSLKSTAASSSHVRGPCVSAPLSRGLSDECSARSWRLDGSRQASLSAVAPAPAAAAAAPPRPSRSAFALAGSSQELRVYAVGAGAAAAGGTYAAYAGEPLSAKTLGDSSSVKVLVEADLLALLVDESNKLES